MSLKQNDTYQEDVAEREYKSIGQIFDAYESKDINKQQFGDALQEFFKTLSTTPYERPLTKHEQRAKELKAKGHVLARQHYTQEEAV